MHESRAVVSPASSPRLWLEFELYPGKEVGRTDNRSSFWKEELREEPKEHCLNRGLIGYIERSGIVSD